MHELKSFRIFQTAKVFAVLYAILGFIEGAIVAIVSLRHPPMHPARMIVFVLIVLPILATVVGFIFIAIMCWLYNVVAARLGGIAFTLTPRSDN